MNETVSGTFSAGRSWHRAFASASVKNIRWPRGAVEEAAASGRDSFEPLELSKPGFPKQLITCKRAFDNMEHMEALILVLLIVSHTGVEVMALNGKSRSIQAMRVRTLALKGLATLAPHAGR